MEEVKNSQPTKDEVTPSVQPKKVEPHKKKKNSNEDFKRKYFDYYDDIKISDRQDW